MEQVESRKRCVCPQLMGNQNGIGVISILVTVIIFLVILTGVFAMVGRTTEGAKLQQAQQDIAAIQMATRQTYATSKTYAGLDNATAIKAGILPEAMVSGGSGVNPWGGSVTVAVDTTPTQFTIAYAGLPQDACMQLAAYGNGNWASAKAGTTTIPQNGTGVVAAAATGCATATGNTVTFVSK